MKLLFDIGGTTTRLGIASTTEGIDEIITYPTPQEYKEGLAKLKETSEALAKGNSIESVAGGIAGSLDSAKSGLIHGGNIPDWVEKSFAQDLQNLFGAINVIIENDTAAGALGESFFGAARNYSSMMYLALGTGVGGAWVVDKQLINKPYGFEPGHQIIDYQNKSSLQDLISGKALGKLYGRSTAEINSEELWQEIAQPLIIGLTNTFLHWPSNVIVLGGGVILGHTFPISELREALQERIPAIKPYPPVVVSELGDYSALYGALHLLNKKESI